MKILLLCLALAFSTVACWDDVDTIRDDNQCVHIDFTDQIRGHNETRPIDGIYCVRDTR